MTFAATILTLYPEIFHGLHLAARYDELSVNTRAKDGVNWSDDTQSAGW